MVSFRYSRRPLGNGNWKHCCWYNPITLPISVDLAFNFGAYDITPFIYGGVVFQCKYKNVAKKWVLATMVGPTIIHQNKSADTYESAMRCITKKCDLKNRSEIYIITDGEPALIVTYLKSFSKCSLLTCTRHFEANCREILIREAWKMLCSVLPSMNMHSLKLKINKV